MGLPAVEVEGLGKRYALGRNGANTSLREFLAGRMRRQPSDETILREVWALRDVSFSMDEGEVLGIIGRNGSGKSTLLKIMARITQPTTGETRVRGRVGSLLEVGTGFHEDLTGRENVFLNGAILGMSRRDIDLRFDEIVEFSGVSRFLDVPIKRYSSGMKLRLAFAVAAHLEPEVVIVDEVLAVGDAEFQKRCLGKMSEFHRAGRTVLFVSHDTSAVAQLCTRTIWLDGGRIHADDVTERVLDQYERSHGTTGLRSAFGSELLGPVALRSLELLDGGGEPVPDVRRDEPFALELRFETVEAHPGLDCALYLVNERGVRVIDEALGEHPLLRQRLAQQGEHRLVMEVPPLLAAGDYSIFGWFGTDRSDYFDDRLGTLTVRPRPDDRPHDVRKPRIIVGATRWQLDTDAVRT
jgi:ABC-type polysaccharide/polyol phosphate transport system ATPase subunit